jgi:retrograde regulation protein 2
MPTIFQDRADISLSSARLSDSEEMRGCIPTGVIDAVVARLSRFQITCEDFNVPPGNIQVLATEATRTAPNATELTSRVREATGWDVCVLSKEDEGRIGALGVASSSSSVEGLVMDLGGGSVQITWMVIRDGVVTTSSKGSISLPYGTAVLSKKLEEVRTKGTEMEEELKRDMIANFQNAYSALEVPEALLRTAEVRGGFDLYLSGGGFRGWGYLLMSQSKINPYPIPIINGFRVIRADFHDTIGVLNTLTASGTKIFRISKRRASQVPAVAFLVNVLSEALPTINWIQFCQGGVREGFLYDKMSTETRGQDPLLVATAPYAPQSTNAILDLLTSALPDTSSPVLSRRIPSSFTQCLLLACVNTLFSHSSISKESRPAAALYSTTLGVLASVNSLTHLDRALLALILSERWAGDLAPTEKLFQTHLSQIVSPQEAWWCKYLGRVAALVGDIYPAGVLSGSCIRFKTTWQKSTRKKQGTTENLLLDVDASAETAQRVNLDIVKDAVVRIEKIGKKKNWVKAGDRVGPDRMEGDYGVKVVVSLCEI